MIQLISSNRHFKPHWAMTFLAVLAIALFLRLGFWQLERADEKNKMITALKVLSQQTPVAWSSMDPLPKQYQPIAVQGRFLPQVLLLDNQHHEHQFGYDVVSALEMPDGHVVLVDRGWVPGDASRRLFPSVETPSATTHWVGTVYYPSEKNWLLGPGLETKEADLAVIELLDTHLISQFLHKSVYPFIIRLGQEAAHGYVREWPVVAMSPERHYGYALQWFAMALVILVLYVSLNLTRKTTL